MIFLFWGSPFLLFNIQRIFIAVSFASDPEFVKKTLPDEKDINTTEKINDFFSDPEDLGYYYTKGLGLEPYDSPSEGLLLGTLSDNY